MTSTLLTLTLIVTFAVVLVLVIYLGLAASAVLVAFGMTIVVKRAAQPYTVVAPDDDVE